MVHLFIDTNRYLTLYGFSKQTLEEIKKLIALIKQSKIILYLPEQVENEFKRNREGYLQLIYEKIKSLVVQFGESEIPEILKNEDELEGKVKVIIESQKTIKEKNEQIKSAAEEIEKKFLKKIKENSFLVDEIISEIFSIAKKIPCNKKIFNKATTRFRLGNPPGKKNSYGDSVIWESLLEEVAEGENLHFVGFNSDFKSKINRTEFSPFLLEEWSKKKKSKIIPFQHLGDFTKSQIPEIEHPDKIIESEYETENEYLLSSDALNRAMRNTLAWKEALTQALGNMVFPAEVVRQEALKMSAYKEALTQALANASFSTEQVIQAILNMRIPSGVSLVSQKKKLTKNQKPINLSQKERRTR